MKKILSMLLALTVLAGTWAMTGCDRGTETDRQIDVTKTQINVGLYAGGYGREWLDNFIVDFEAKYADYVSPDGKKGIQVMVYTDKTYVGSLLAGTLPSSSIDVVFAEDCYYDEMRSVLLDITDMVTKPLNYNFITGETEADTESTSIMQKMDDVHNNYFNVGTSENPQYYAIPYFETAPGIIYDVTLFQDELLYFSANPKVNGGFITSLDDTFSNGPDGLPNTSDDGLPATYEEFYKLCDRMIDKSIVPLTWPGKHLDYITTFLSGLWADYEGAKQMQLNFDPAAGTPQSLIDVASDGTISAYAGDTALTDANAYLTWAKQAGKYYALSFLEQIVTKKHNGKNYYNSNKSFSNSFSQNDAQNAFVTGRHISGNEVVGMLIDMSNWYTEAEDTIAQTKKNAPATASDDKLNWAYMPLPKANADKAGGFTLIESFDSMAFINKNTDEKKIPLAKEFLKHLQTNRSLIQWTQWTNTYRPFTYDFDTESQTFKQLPKWTQNLYYTHRDVQWLVPGSKNVTYLKRASNLKLKSGAWGSIVKGNAYNVPVSALRNGVSAIEYFTGMTEYFERTWSTIG